MKKLIFFGAGNIGIQTLKLCLELGFKPDYFVDNSSKLWGTYCHGIKIISIDEILHLGQVQILITCDQVESISRQLLEIGINSEDIFACNTFFKMLNFIAKNIRDKLSCDNLSKGCNLSATHQKPKVLFDLQYGFVLGGVESWAVQMEEELLCDKTDVKYIIPDTVFDLSDIVSDKVILFESCSIKSIAERVRDGLYKIKKSVPCNIVCNFPSETCLIAGFAKLLWPEYINLIAVVHNDEGVYYRSYGEMSTLIDYCLVTCDMMEKYFVKCGMDKEKIMRLTWMISCEEVLDREYSREGQPLSIGYAGRIVKEAKRLDLLIEIVRGLKEKNIDFQLNIAGNGEYEEELKKTLTSLSDSVHFVGTIKREYIADFWKKQDIGINCSDYEGRCISRAESMASGAVPVVTDTSGVGDDMINGYHGYIVPIGDVDAMIERICYLYEHRGLLKVMGERAHQIILQQNRDSDLNVMWKKIIKCW